MSRCLMNTLQLPAVVRQFCVYFTAFSAYLKQTEVWRNAMPVIRLRFDRIFSGMGKADKIWRDCFIVQYQAETNI